MKSIILASSSKIRATLLQTTNLEFSIIAPSIDESLIKTKIYNPTPSKIAKKCATEKALSISKIHPQALVIGADQVCNHNDQLFSKPLSIEKAITQLTELNGKTHQLTSGLCIAKNSKIIWEHVEIVELTMKQLSLDEITTYVKEDLPLYSCGAYKYESLGNQLFNYVSGSSDAIQGLPLTPLLTALSNHH